MIINIIEIQYFLSMLDISWSILSHLLSLKLYKAFRFYYEDLKLCIINLNKRQMNWMQMAGIIKVQSEPYSILLFLVVFRQIKNTNHRYNIENNENVNVKQLL